MEVEEVIKRAYDLQQKLEDVDGLSSIYPLWVETNGDYWVIAFSNISLLDSELWVDPEVSDDVFEERIIEELGSIRKYLNTVLARFDA